MKDISKANFIKINLETPQNCQHPYSIDLSRPRIIILGGENTQICNQAYYYATSIARTLHLNGITEGLDIYSAYYKIKERNNGMDRLNLFTRITGKDKVISHLHHNKSAELDWIDYATMGNEEYPNYINDIFNFVFSPQLTAPNGWPLKHKKALENFRNTIIYTHCHGTYVLRMCEQMMQDDYLGDGFSPSEIQSLQKNLMAINYAPFAPLNNWKFSALSFVSASDYSVSYYNELDYHMKSTPEQFAPAFYDYKFGNIMIANKLKKDPAFEHSDVGMSGSEDTEAKLTHNGKVLFAAERNALLRGVKDMLSGGAGGGQNLPEIQDLIGTSYATYDQLKRQGAKILRHFNIKEL